MNLHKSRSSRAEAQLKGAFALNFKRILQLRAAFRLVQDQRSQAALSRDPCSGYLEQGNVPDPS